MPGSGGGVRDPGWVGVGPGGGAWSRGGCLVPGGIPACTETVGLPPVNRMTDRCKNIFVVGKNQKGILH